MLLLVSDENFNNDIVRGLLRRKPDLDIVRVQDVGWREFFTDEHKKLFKDVAGDLVVRLGYEKTNDW